MKHLIILFFIGFSNSSFAQMNDSLPQNKVVVFKDYRLNILARKETELNAINYKRQQRTVMGYRLMVLNTNDKDYAFKIRAELLKKFPDQKPYMWYSSPYIRIKFGDFKTKEEAEIYRKQISDMLGGATVYYLEEPVEIDPNER